MEPEGVVFVTNRHIVDIEYYARLSGQQQYSGQGYKVSSIRILTFKGAERFTNVIHEVKLSWPSDDRVDIAILRNPKVIDPKGTVTPGGAEVIADNDFLRNKLVWGDFVSFASFQAWRDSKSERPILRTGIVASDPLYSYESDKIPLRDILLLEALSFAGSSGSPVFANARGIKVGDTLTGGSFRPAKIIGINAGHLPAPPDLHSGLSYCHRSDLLLKILTGKESMETQVFHY